MGRDIHMFIEVKNSASSSGWSFIGPYWYSKYSEAIVPMGIMSGRDYAFFDWLDSHSDGILKADDLSEDIHAEYERWDDWEIKWIDYKSIAKVSEMYDKIPDVVFKDLKPFDWEDCEWYDDDALNELDRFRREKMYVSSFVSKISSYVDDLDLYMANSIRVVWWIDC